MFKCKYCSVSIWLLKMFARATCTVWYPEKWCSNFDTTTMKKQTHQILLVRHVCLKLENRGVTLTSVSLKANNCKLIPKSTAKMRPDNRHTKHSLSTQHPVSICARLFTVTLNVLNDDVRCVFNRACPFSNPDCYRLARGRGNDKLAGAIVIVTIQFELVPIVREQ